MIPVTSDHNLIYPVFRCFSAVCLRCVCLPFWFKTKTHAHLQVDTDATVLTFKQKIAEKAGVAPELQRLIYKGRVMKEDQNTLASYSKKMQTNAP